QKRSHAARPPRRLRVTRLDEKSPCQPARGPMRAPELSKASSSPPSLAQLYFGFAQIALSAFGGALPWARRILVEDKGWLDPDDFTDTLALCQFLPGPNVINLSIVVGSRFRGP